MSSVPLHKRPKDIFISYSRNDYELVFPIVDWLEGKVGLKIWMDRKSGYASTRTTDDLSKGILESRGVIFFLSSNWKSSTWCTDEHEFALTERRNNNEFLVMAVQLEDCDLPSWFKISHVLDFRKFQSRTSAALLRSLSPNPPSRFDANYDIYLAAPWSSPTEATKKAVKSIASMGWRLVGDSPEYPNFDDETKRISSIISTSKGMICVFPYNSSKPPYFTSRYILEEAYIALRCQHSYLLLAESEVQIPQELIDASFGNRTIQISGENDNLTIHHILDEFDEELTRKPFSDARTYSFLATSLNDESGEIDDLTSVVMHASNMDCEQGRRLEQKGQYAQQTITDRICRAAFVIADVTDNPLNTLIETGIAMGAGTPLHLMCKKPESGFPTIRFMFRHMEINWYQNSVERLAIAYRISKLYRRRVYSLR